MNVQLADSSIADRMIERIQLQDGKKDFFDRFLGTLTKAAPIAATAAAAYYGGGAGAAGLSGSGGIGSLLSGLQGGQSAPQGGYAPPPQQTNYMPFILGGVGLLAVVLLTQKK